MAEQDSRKWKSRLVSSSLPLEYEVAKLLVSKGFAITADFTYTRSDVSLVKDFSVDIHGTHYITGLRSRPMCALELIIECKQRARSKWLCFQDPNTEDFLPAAWGHSIRVVDQFSRWFVSNQWSALDDRSIPVCYKALEVDEDGKAYDAELRHGLFQLQYALPRLASDHVRTATENPEQERAPAFFGAILVTNAELIVAHRNITIQKIERAKSLLQLGRVAPFVVYYLDVGSELERHCARECSDLQTLHTHFSKSDRYRIQNGAYDSALASSMIHNLVAGGKGGAPFFSHFLVCNVAALPSLLGTIKSIAARHARQMIPKLLQPRARRKR